MIIRIVQMSFQENKIAEFLNVFSESAEAIRRFPGCLHLELWQSKTTTHVYFTYSHWENEQALNDYRFAPLFKTTWSRTKRLFSADPAAWSMDKVWPASLDK